VVVVPKTRIIEIIGVIVMTATLVRYVMQR